MNDQFFDAILPHNDISKGKIACQPNDARRCEARSCWSQSAIPTCLIRIHSNCARVFLDCCWDESHNHTAEIA